MTKKAIVEITARIETELDPLKMGTENEAEALIVLRAATTAAFRSIFGESGEIKVKIETEDTISTDDSDTKVDIKG